MRDVKSFIFKGYPALCSKLRTGIETTLECCSGSSIQLELGLKNVQTEAVSLTLILCLIDYFN